MKENLVIVESPSKSKTIEKYLGEDYKVVSSKGHIRDLATSGKFGLGVDIENNFEAKYIPLSNKKSLIKDLKKDVKNAKNVILATDPDREGEAISWHLLKELGISEDNYQRVLFHEITKDKVLESIKNPSKIDMDLVRSQETRRILDRIIGFRLSKLMQSKTSGKSAGRVQSVALKLIVDREREIAAFNKEEYWTVTAKFDDFDSVLFEYNDKKIELKTEEETDKVLANLYEEYKVISKNVKDRAKKSKAPFTTSTMQQDASTKLGFSAKKTMSIAQKLYEGIDLENETVGLITYMRTDSIRLSDEFTKSCQNYIKENIGREYVGKIKVQKVKDNVQDAHEAIRPTSVFRTPESVKKYLTSDEYKLYRMIYVRAVSSLMKDAKVKQEVIIFDNNNYHFKTTGQTLIFDGYLKLYKDYENSEDKILPLIEDNDVVRTKIVEKQQHFTQPPARYTEAKLIKEMEALGIGRPSTYAKTIDTLKVRNYVILEEKKFIPTETGIEITDKLQEFFSDLINVEYTKNMETDLDKIAEEGLDNIKVLRDFYNLFEKKVEEAFSNMEKSTPVETGELCPNCGSPMVIKKGKYGEFEACSNYPTCKYIKKEEKVEVVITDCPVCKVGKIVEKKTKRGKIFYGCNNYPTCKTATWDIPTGDVCSECKSLIVRKNNEDICSNKDCKSNIK